MSIHNYVLTQLSASKGNWPAVARATGVSYRTLKKIATREIENPRVANLELLANYFKKTPQAS